MVSTFNPDLQKRVNALAEMLAAYLTHLEQAEDEISKAEEKRETWAQRVETVSELLEFERKNTSIPDTSDKANPYAGLSFRDAVIEVIKRAGKSVTRPEKTVTDDDIISDLLAWNFPLTDKRYPGRSIHAAMIGVESIEKVAKGRYRWKGAPPPGEQGDLLRLQAG